MPQPPDWNKYLDAGAEFVAMTRAQARKRAKELVGTGQLAQEQVQGFVDDLVDESRKRTDVLLDVVRKEIQRQVKTLGIATKDDLARLETKIAKQTKPEARPRPPRSPRAPHRRRIRRRPKRRQRRRRPTEEDGEEVGQESGLEGRFLAARAESCAAVSMSSWCGAAS